MKSKHASIVDLVRRLAPEARGWVVLDHWEGDRCAIGIASATEPSRIVYVCTFRKRAGCYDYECEEAPRDRDELYSVASRGEDVTFDTLLARILVHLHPSDGAVEPPSR